MNWMRDRFFSRSRCPSTAEDNYGTLYDRLAERGAALLVQALEMLRRGEAVKVPQDEAEVTLAPPLTREMRRAPLGTFGPGSGGLDPGPGPQPGASALWRGRVLKFFGARLKKREGQPGAAGHGAAPDPSRAGNRLRSGQHHG